MIQFNLLPDVKLEYVKAQRTKHAVISGAVIASGAALVVFVLLFMAVHVVQKKVISDQTADIKKYTTELKNTRNIDKILTIQNQLGAMSGLHASKPAAERNFALIQQLTPKDVSLTNYGVDYIAKTISISGTSPRLELVNAMADTMKYATYNSKAASGGNVFSDVVLSEFSRSQKNTTFTITASYDPVIFDNTAEVTFTVPNAISTPSVVGQPTTVFTNPANGNQ